ncbi:MAG: hypothetical protein IPL88_01335 [Rhizobiales bacterium]|nr:hypothetical protein [Hyphomicrobiales bacterium]
MTFTKIEISQCYGERAFVLDRNGAEKLRKAAALDGAWLYRSAVLSLISGLTSLELGYRSWPVIQMYYSAFFAVKSILFSNAICLYYNLKKPMKIECITGSSPTQLKYADARSSHKCAFKEFSQTFNNHQLNGYIGVNSAFDWIQQKREEVNYSNYCMNMDDIYEMFHFVDGGIRKIVLQYAGDMNIHAFLPEHAMIAFPMLAVRSAKSSLRLATWLS